MKKTIFLLFIVFILFPFFVFAANGIDINTATLQQLDEIVHVGPTIAQRIIDNRPYSSVQDLSKVKGIGNGKYLQDIINQGLACVNCGLAQEAAQPTPPAPETAPTAPTQLSAVYPGGIFINEILPNPEGPDETDEWIELYNSNNFDVDLSGWQLRDTAGTITAFTILPNTKISANGYTALKRPDTKIMLNNDQDGLNFLSPDGKLVDSMSYALAPLGQSYNKNILGSWQWSSTITPALKNIVTTVKSIANTDKTLSKPKNSVKNNGVELGLADLSLPAQASQSINQDNNLANPWFLFFIVLATAIILALIVLFIKSKQHVRT